MSTQLSVELTLTDEEIDLLIEWYQHYPGCKMSDEHDTLYARLTLAKERMATNVPVEDEKSV